ncbi:CDP-alcohol phosphatidyltransferase family protein [candidate division NPL-UPA2 bacterium]|nr:CDP-alcohol phosphatidyltransferase family protein [candidate division NPL-UPA2 bacterium]
MNIPNCLTIVRILLIPLFIITLGYHQAGNDGIRLLALAIFSLASLTDALDGLIARTRGERTKLGSYLDPLADKLLLNVSFVLLAITESLPCRLPAWMPVVVVSRDVILVIGGALILISSGDLKLRPSFLGKMTTVSQSGVVILTLLNLSLGVLKPIWILAICFTIVSFFDYVLKGGRILNERKV